MRKLLFICAALVLAGRSYAAPSSNQVLSDVGITNVVNASLVALSTLENRAVVTAQRGTNYLAVVAYRSDSSRTNRWMLARRELRSEDVAGWVLGTRLYPRQPSRQDIEKLLGEFFSGGHASDFVFLGLLK